MNITPRDHLQALIEQLLRGDDDVATFCAEFEQAYNLGLDHSSLSESEAREFGALFDVVVWYSPFPEERAEIPNYKSEEDVLLAAKSCAFGITQI